MSENCLNSSAAEQLTHHHWLRRLVRTRHWFRLVLLLANASLCVPAPLAMAQEPSESPTAVSVFVCDEDSNPIKNATVQLMIWGRKWSPLDFNGMTRENGELEFSKIPAGEYLSVEVKHANFAPFPLFCASCSSSGVLHRP